RQRDSEAQIRTQCVISCDGLRDDLDRRILHQAHTLVSVSQSLTVHAEGHLFLFAIRGAGAMPGGYLNSTLFAFQATSDKVPGTNDKGIAVEIFRAQPMYTQIPNGDNLVAAEDGIHA